MADLGSSASPPRRASDGTPPAVPDHELICRIGYGAYGEVWLARNIMGAWRAVKVVYLANGDEGKAFEREFRGIQSYEPISRTDDSLMNILHVGRNEEKGFFFYVMELADDANAKSGIGQSESSGSQLDDPATYVPKTLKNELQRRGPLAIAECVELGLTLSSALAVLHSQDLVHRDIKPSNIIYVKGRAKLADIGLVSRSDATVSFAGTVGYLPPEGPGTAQADLYSLGKVLYEASTGKDRQLFPEPVTALSHGESVSLWAEFNEVLLKACAPLPKDRYVSAEAFQEDLTWVKAGRSLRKARATERRLRQTFAFAVVAVVFGAVAFLFQKSRTTAAHERLMLVEAREQEQSRQILMQKIQEARTFGRSRGWSDRAWQSVTAAAAVRKDDTLRDSAFASLCGLDAKEVWGLTNFSACSVAFDREGKRLLVGGISEGAKLWSFDSGKTSSSQMAKPGPVVFAENDIPVQFVPESYGSFLLWDIENERPMRRFVLPGLKQPGQWPAMVRSSMAISPDAAFVAAGECFEDGSGKYAAWDALTGQLLFENQSKVFSLCFSSDGSLCAAGDDDGNITLWSVAERRILAMLKDDRLSIRSLAFGQNTRPFGREARGNASQLLAAGDEGGTITIWDLSERSVRARLKGSSYRIYALAFGPDGTLLGSAGRFEARIWDVTSGELLLKMPDGDMHTGIAFSPDGQKVALCNQAAFGTKPGLVKVYQLENGRGISSLRGLGGPFGALAISPDRRWIAGLSHNWTVGIWERKTGQLKHTFQVQKGEIAEYAWLGFSPDSSQIGFAIEQKGGVWDVTSGRECASWDFSAPRLANRDAVLPQESEQKQGFACRYWYEKSGQLIQLTFANETKAGEAHRDETTQFTWAIRNVLQTGSPRIVGAFERRNFRWAGAEIGNNGLQFVIGGSENEDGRVTSVLTVFHMNTGKELWKDSRVVKSPSYAPPVLDSTRSLVAYGYESKYKVADISTGTIKSRINGSPVLLGLQGEYWVARNSSMAAPDEHGWSLYRSDSTAPITLFDTRFDNKTFCGAFSQDGSLLAWGNLDGTISVCKLEAVRHRLGTLGMGW